GRRAVKRPDISLLTAGRAVPFIPGAPVLRTALVSAIGGVGGSLPTGRGAGLLGWGVPLLGWAVYVATGAGSYRPRAPSLGGGGMAVGDPVAHHAFIREALRNLDVTLELDHPAVLANTDAWYREQSVALPRVMYAAAHVFAAGDDARARCLVQTVDPAVLRVA